MASYVYCVSSVTALVTPFVSVRRDAREREIPPKVGSAGPPVHLTVDDLAHPLGLGLGDVFFGWYLGDTRPDALQSAYQVVVSRSTVTKAGARTAHDRPPERASPTAAVQTVSGGGLA